MVSALDPGSCGLGASPGQGHCVVFMSWSRHLTLAVSLPTQVYKLVAANLVLGGNPAID